MFTNKPATVEEYISGFPKEIQTILQEVRALIRKEVPDAEEMISYGIPTFKLKGQVLIYFAGYQKHISIYPAPRGNEMFKEELARYKGGKGTVQFPIGKPIPFDLIFRMLKFRLEESAKKAVKKKGS
jgi:uncharacterized protein YdhG (YjbR/CyaY superfamily)